MFEHLDDFRGEAPFGVWVRSIAVSRCLMAFRSPWHRARVALESWTEDSGAVRRIRQAAPRISSISIARWQKLSPLTRAVVWLYDVEGWSHDEIAQAFDRTVSFSKSQLARGHARLRDRLARAGESGARHSAAGVSSMDSDRHPRRELVGAAEAPRCGRRRGGPGFRLRRHARRGMPRGIARSRRGWCWRAAPRQRWSVALVGASVWRLDQRGCGSG